MISTDRLVVDTSAFSHLRAGHSLVLDCVARAGVGGAAIGFDATAPWWNW